MYQKPTLKKFGTFRELTQFGTAGASDGQVTLGDPGCLINDVSFGCPTTS